MTEQSTNTRRQPVVFVGHGSPLNAIKDNDIRHGWVEMGERLGKPEAIVAVSAHWFTEGRFVRTAKDNRQVNDMYGFPEELYQIHYEPANDQKLAARVLQLVPEARENNEWGIDHGVWSVLCNMYPNADVPVVMVSTDGKASPQEHFELGRKLAALRDDGAMILASGNVVHNLGAVNWSMTDGFGWNREFDETVRDAILSRDFGKVVDYQNLPDWKRSIPTPDHFLPLLTALGAVRDDDEIEVWNEIRELGSMSQTSYLFK